jgi:hypothetical protein
MLAIFLFVRKIFFDLLLIFVPLFSEIADSFLQQGNYRKVFNLLKNFEKVFVKLEGLDFFD